MTENATLDKWLDTSDPTPRLGWYKDRHTGRVHISKRQATSKRKFGSTSARPQQVYWRAEDDIAYFTWKYGWTCCYYCRDCSCCCKCHGPPAWSISISESDDEDTSAEQPADADAPPAVPETQMQQTADGWQTIRRAARSSSTNCISK